MFGTSSKTTVKNLTKNITNAISNIVQSCEVLSEQNQNLDIGTSGFNLFSSYKLKQFTEINSSCFSDVSKQTDIQNAIKDSIMQTSSAQGQSVSLAFGKTESEAYSELDRLITTNITMENIQKQYTKIQQNQNARDYSSGVVIARTVEMEQGAKVFAEATMQLMEKAGIINKIESHLDQTSSSVTKGLFDGLFDMLTSPFRVFLIIFLVIIFMIFGLPLLKQFVK